jgi:hypothetical protein
MLWRVLRGHRDARPQGPVLEADELRQPRAKIEVTIQSAEQQSRRELPAQ